MNGIELSKIFLEEAVNLILDQKFPDLRCSAGLLSDGSEVLSYDDEQSQDHDFGREELGSVDQIVRDRTMVDYTDLVHQLFSFDYLSDTDNQE